MWKAMIILAIVLAIPVITNSYAAGIEPVRNESFSERAERNVEFNNRSVSDDTANFMNFSEDIKAGFVFGLNNDEESYNDGPQDNSGGMGIGIGFGFSF
ncbi:hypothetical protein [Maridesulfovibrio sp.]|uniref:hypothetical protein n=1 Tax=Maridesulfovibrio sp. TaxID=2795000 RepID=UPI002A18D313|nr:hypothetical protein [Maridesulfovibrio sp.]